MLNILFKFIVFLDMGFNVAKLLLKWIYTDYLDNELGDVYILDLLSASLKFKLESLRFR